MSANTLIRDVLPFGRSSYAVRFPVLILNLILLSTGSAAALAQGVAYRTSDEGIGPRMDLAGAGRHWADDLRLDLAPGDRCELVSLKVAFNALPGATDMVTLIDLRNYRSASSIPGTKFLLNLASDEPDAVVEKTIYFAPGIVLPNPVYLTWEQRGDDFSPAFSESVDVGANSAEFYQVDESGWTPVDPAVHGPMFVVAELTCRTAAGPEMCASVVASEPGSCAVDARRPHPIGNPSLHEGWDHTDIRIEGACSMSALAAQGFYAFSIPDPAAAPTIAKTDMSSGDQIGATFDRPITPGQWTCVRNLMIGEVACLGFLPGDVNGNRISDAADIGTFVEFLDGAVSLPDYASDLNRSGRTTLADLIELVDLLNGAGAFEAWGLIGSLPACPGR